MKKDYALLISNVSKKFMLPHEKQSSLKNVVTGIFNNGVKSTEQIALKNINLKINKGEFFGIVGRNGSGKSTLLKIIAGIYQPTKGSVEVRGKLVPFIELGVGFNPELTGRENVFLNGAILGFNRKQINKNYKKIVDFAELADHMDVKLKNYSSGMQVRLAFACATMANADILLIDEVLAVGDADFQRKCFDYFKSLKSKATTVVFVTHSMDAVREYCDSAALIVDSKVSLIGKPEKIATEYLRLFNKENGPSRAPIKTIERWGNNKVYFPKKPKIEITSKRITIKIQLKVNTACKDLVLGFSISNTSSQHVMGTNSYIINKKPLIIDVPGYENYIWEIDNILSEGNYILNIAAVSNDGATVFDWWDDCVTFEVFNEHSTPYIVSPKVSLIKL
jgi:ABC-2 type transport system ATP-binding protein